MIRMKRFIGSGSDGWDASECECDTWYPVTMETRNQNDENPFPDWKIKFRGFARFEVVEDFILSHFKSHDHPPNYTYSSTV